MKCRILCFLCVLLVSVGHAQDETYFENDKTFYGGLVFGLNAAQVDGDTYAGFHKVGLNLGGLVFLRLSESVAMSMEMLYSQKGARGIQELYDPYAGAYTDKYKIDLNYVEVPVVFNYFLSSKYQVGLGASYNALISSKETIPGTYYQLPNEDPERFAFNRHTVDVIGSVSMMVWKGLMLNARYQYSLTPVRNWNRLPGIGFGNQLNNMVTFRVAYLF